MAVQSYPYLKPLTWIYPETLHTSCTVTYGFLCKIWRTPATNLQLSSNGTDCLLTGLGTRKLVVREAE